MCSPDILTFVGPGRDLCFRAKLLVDANQRLVEDILSICPLNSFLLHVVVAGETIYLPVPSVPVRSKIMVTRRKGAIYYNAIGQSICICYGSVTESTLVNQFAQVLEEDMPELEYLGRLVIQQTMEHQTPSIVRVRLQRCGDDDSGAGSAARCSSVTIPKEPKPWHEAKGLIDQEVTQLRLLEEPAAIRAIRLGVVRAQMGRNRSPLGTMIILQGFLSTLGPHILARLVKISEDPDMTLGLMVKQTRAFLTESFNHFDFLSDLGLDNMTNIGKAYSTALDSLDSMDEYRELTDSLRTLVQLWNRWNHLVFPWHLGEQIASLRPAEINGISGLECYSPSEQ